MLTTQEAADTLGVTPSRVRQLIRANALKARRRGRDWYIRMEDLDNVRNRKTKPGRMKKEI